MPERILVTGGAGYIGAVLLPVLLDHGYDVRVLDRLYWGRKVLAAVEKDIEVIDGDVRRLPSRILDGVDGVIHLAGLSNDPTAEYDPEANWSMNALATENLAQECVNHRIERFTFGSSCSVYDTLPVGPVYREDIPVTPRGAYATSKAYAETALLERASPGGFSPAILRQGTVYGPSPRMRYDLVVHTFLRDAMTQRVINLHGGGQMSRPLVDIRDVAEAHVQCLKASPDVVGGQIYNVVEHNYIIRDLASIVAAELGRHEIDVDLVDAPLPSIVRDYRCSNERLTKAVGFTPTRGVREGVPELLSFITENGLDDFDNDWYYNIRWIEGHRSLLELPALA
jgi:nucleoside-diphosphate-sugar epimerase